MNRKRLLEEDTNEFDTKKAKVQISNDNDICISEEMEKELKLLDINYPIDLEEEIKAKKILHKASRNECVNVLLKILKLNKLNINERDWHGFTPLHLAAKNGHTRSVVELLAHGADIELPKGNRYTKFRCQVHNCGTSALHLASKYGHVGVVKELLKYKPDLSQRDETHYTALQIACEEGHLEVVKELLRSGANIHENHLETELLPIFIAVFKKNFPIFKELLERGADPFTEHDTPKGIITAIGEANFDGQFEMVEHAVVNCDQSDSEVGWTKLHNASDYGSVNAISTLITKGYSVNSITAERHRTPLHIASDKEVVKILLDHGANVNIQNDKGNTPLHTALGRLKMCVSGKYCNCGYDAGIHFDMISLLLSTDEIDLSIKNNKGQTVLQMAIELSFKHEIGAKIARKIAKITTKSRITDSIYPLKQFL